MKKTHLSALLMLIIIVISGCKKSSTNPVNIVGLWSGNYGNGLATPYAPYKMLFRADGTVRVFDGADTATASKAEGTYTVSDSVRTYYTYFGGSSFSTAALLNGAGNRMNGTWGNGTSTAGSGTFFLTTNVNIVGLWAGTYDGSSPYAMLFRADGTVRVFDGADTTTASIGEGTYTISDSVRTHYTYLTGGMYSYSTAAKLNTAVTSMAGTYGSNNSTAGAGVIALTY